MLSYLAEAPLSNLANKVTPLESLQLRRQATASPPVEFSPNSSWVLPQNMLEEHCNLASQAAHMKLQLEQLLRDREQVNEKFEGVEALLYERNPLEEWRVDNELSNVSHRALITLSTSPSSWSTCCGWKFAGKEHAVTTRFTGENDSVEDCRKCPKCYRPAKGDESASSSSSDDTSDD